MVAEIKRMIVNTAKRLAQTVVLIFLGIISSMSLANGDLVPRSCRYVLAIQSIEKKDKVEISNQSTSTNYRGVVASVLIEKRIDGGDKCKAANEALKVLLLHKQDMTLAAGDRITAIHQLDDLNAMGNLYKVFQMYVDEKLIGGPQ